VLLSIPQPVTQNKQFVLGNSVFQCNSYRNRIDIPMEKRNDKTFSTLNITGTTTATLNVAMSQQLALEVIT
jgi:hypothetical protein